MDTVKHLIEIVPSEKFRRNFYSLPNSGKTNNFKFFYCITIAPGSNQ